MHVLSVRRAAKSRPDAAPSVRGARGIARYGMKEIKRLVLEDRSRAVEVFKALASEPRLAILELLKESKLNVNAIAGALGIPQSSAATHIGILEEAGLLDVEAVPGRRGTQKYCSFKYEELILGFPGAAPHSDRVAVDMPVGLYTNFEAAAPCGLCSADSIIGYLDVPDSFLSPERMQAALVWCASGFFEYRFPNNARYDPRPLTRLDLSAELSSEIPGTDPTWKSDIALHINGAAVGTWTAPGDFGDRRGASTPPWWKLKGSQYGILARWSVTDEGTYLQGERCSDVRLQDLALADHHSVRVRFSALADSPHPGGMNIFGKGFGDYGQGVVLEMGFAP